MKCKQIDMLEGDILGKNFHPFKISVHVTKMSE